MTWHAVFSAEPTHRFNLDVLGFFPAWPLINVDDLDIALPTPPKPTPSLPPLLEQSLHARAIRVCNREPKAIARYMQKHTNLISER